MSSVESTLSLSIFVYRIENTSATASAKYCKPEILYPGMGKNLYNMYKYVHLYKPNRIYSNIKILPSSTYRCPDGLNHRCFGRCRTVAMRLELGFSPASFHKWLVEPRLQGWGDSFQHEFYDQPQFPSIVLNLYDQPVSSNSISHTNSILILGTPRPY